MSMERKITQMIDNEIYCLFCGKIIYGHYEDCGRVYECTCDDSKKELEINEKIFLLNQSRPIMNYRQVSKTVLVKINE